MAHSRAQTVKLASIPPKSHKQGSKAAWRAPPIHGLLKVAQRRWLAGAWLVTTATMENFALRAQPASTRQVLGQLNVQTVTRTHTATAPGRRNASHARRAAWHRLEAVTSQTACAEPVVRVRMGENVDTAERARISKL